MIRLSFARLMSARFVGGDKRNMEIIMNQKLDPVTKSSTSNSSPLLIDSEASKRMLRRLQRLMHDAIHVKNPLVPDKTLTKLREEYTQLALEDRRKALKLLATEFGVDKDRVRNLIEQYQSNNTDAGAQYKTERELRAALVPLSARLFEHMNTQTGGLKFLVDLRGDLLSSLRDDNVPELRALDSDLQGLFSTWLSPACLQLHQITWHDAAALLEKIVRYEAVHPVNNLYDLKRRLGVGRRCFGYFHPAMPGEPLVFIEVALTEKMSDSIQEVLFETPPITEDDARTAIFYSISSTQPGLSGIDLGNFLIKRVLRLVQQEMSHIKTFATLSPIPGFLKWLVPKLAAQCKILEEPSAIESVFKEDLLLPAENKALIEASEDDKPNAMKVLLDLLSDPDHRWVHSEKLSASVRPPLTRLCARYLYLEKKRGKALDPVANFHLRNGASMERINWMGDKSTKGLQDSAGLMVNYLYRWDKIEENNLGYINKGTIEASSQVKEYCEFEIPSAL